MFTLSSMDKGIEFDILEKIEVFGENMWFAVLSRCLYKCYPNLTHRKDCEPRSWAVAGRPAVLCDGRNYSHWCVKEQTNHLHENQKTTASLMTTHIFQVPLVLECTSREKFLGHLHSIQRYHCHHQG